ncbi:hypothetical protein [Candidatus Venteria ishoeyi]|uniref:DUF2281 domain-containing protein n=1 Tax=Candidatus Venteria ishoeyi TaxID=1899563 RepID=A0A1H6FHW0_9GAMM|nr:hypothetical protein [Candidatus Venteria ishoeyi]SEH09011.1 Uncharacterised protein [Candidatus Venteria ishoeyi]
MPTAQVNISTQELLQAVKKLQPIEFEAFLVQILNLQARYQRQTNKPQNFLQTITGLGCSEEKTVSEQADDILRQEIDPIKGWSLK